jgi:site-specific DNA recombinase
VRNNASDWKELASDGVDAAYDSEEKSAKVRIGNEESARDGMHPGGPAPYGYRRVHNEEERRFDWEVDEVTALVVREITERVGAAEPLYAISRDLNERGIRAPRGGRWYDSTVRGIATAEHYVGLRTYRGVTYQGNWVAIVDAAVQASAKRIVGGRQGTGKKADRPGRVLYVLSYHAVCGAPGCGGWMEARHPKNRAPYYICRSPQRHATVNKADLEAFITDLVIGRLMAPDVLKRMTTPDDSAVVEARRQAIVLEQRLEGLTRQVAIGKLDGEGFADARALVLPMLTAARVRAKTAGVPQVILELLDGVETEEELRARWEGRSVTAQRDIIGALFVKIEVFPANGTRGVRGALSPDRVNAVFRESTAAVVA